MDTDNPYKTPTTDIAVKTVRKTYVFRFTVLLAYMLGGSALYSLMIWFSRYPPNRGAGDGAFTQTWVMIVVTGAFTGGVTYMFSFLRRRRARTTNLVK